MDTVRGSSADDLFQPLPLLWKLRTTTSQKSVLTGIFICAGLYMPSVLSLER